MTIGKNVCGDIHFKKNVCRKNFLKKPLPPPPPPTHTHTHTPISKKIIVRPQLSDLMDARSQSLLSKKRLLYNIEFVLDALSPSLLG